ncbi:DBH-like monooxygenase protein 2 homolog [Stigmatopora nigra]
MDYLDSNHSVCIKWGVNSTRGDITIKFIVNTTGWIGFGLSHTGDMTGADLVMAGVGPDGDYFKDYYSAENTYPTEDRQQSYRLLSLNESDGQTHMTFSRDLETCDEQDIPILAKPIYVIYAYGLTDQIGFHYSLVGGKQLNLLASNGDYSMAILETNQSYRDGHNGGMMGMSSHGCNHTANAAAKCPFCNWNQALILLVFFWVALY